MKKDLVFDFQLISKYRDILMGIAITEVILAHFSNWLNAPGMIVKMFSTLVFTQGFLLLSGMGVYYSFSKNSNVLDFYMRRIKRMLLPYMIMAVPFVLFFFISDKDITIIKAIGWITSIGYFFPGESQYCNMWYISMSFVCYAIFPLIYHFIYNGGGIYVIITRCLLLITLYIALTILIYNIMPNYYQLVGVGLPKGCMFVLGVGLGYLCKNAYTIKFKYLLSITVLLYAVLFIMRKQGVLWIQYYTMSEKLLFIPFVCFLLSKINISQTLLWKYLQWAGKYTLEIYVLHLMLKKLLCMFNVDMLTVAFISISISLLIAPFMHNITSKISDKILKIYN